MNDNKPKQTAEKTNPTEFQGAVSLDAILAASKGGKTPTKEDLSKKEDKVEDKIAEASPVVEESKTVEEPKAVEEEKESTVETKSKPVEVPKPEVPNTESESESFKTAQNLIKLGLLEDFEIQLSDDDESPTPISKFTDMTEENLREIIGIQKQEKDKEISSKYLPKGDLKEHQLKVFEILSNGGDLSQIAETPEKALERPFEGFDLEDQQRQVDILYTDLVNQKGLKHDRAIDLIKISVQKGTIQEEAQEVFDAYRGAHKNYIEKIAEETRKQKEFKDLNFKENKKTLTAKLKEAGLKETVYKKVASEYSKKNDNGDYALVDKLREALDNPEDNHELILHLADKGLFNETFKIKASQEVQKTVVSLASKAASKGNRQTTKAQSPEASAPWLKFAQAHNDNIKK